MIKLNNSNFKQTINSGVCVVAFSTTTCPPCIQLSPVLEKLSLSYDNVYKVDCGESGNREMARELNVKSIPTMIYFKDGVEIKRTVGFVQEETIINNLTSIQ